MNALIYQQLKNLAKVNDVVWVAYSGGTDSHALLHLASKIIPKLRAIHINHGLSTQALVWEKHCQHICNQLKVPLCIERVSINPMAGQSLEDAARIARRAVWSRILTKQDIILLAHHQDDQAETILYRLFRGTGPIGLQGMLYSSALNKGKLLRPLLNIAKSAILNYVNENNLKSIDDHSNYDTNYDRNFIRHNILLHIKEKWPAAIKNIARAGELCHDLVNIAQTAINQQLAAVQGSKHNTLSITKLLTLLHGMRRSVLRAWLATANCIASYASLQRIELEVMQARSDADPLLKIGKFYIKRYRDDLYILLAAAYNKKIFFESYWDLKDPLILPDNSKLSIKDSNANVVKNYSRVMVKMGIYGRTAKKIFQKYAIPPWERCTYPLIFCDMHLISIIGLWQSNKYNVGNIVRCFA